MNPQAIEQIPGQLNNRKTIMGELNWIFTAITDTIAWNILSSFSLLSSLFSLLSSPARSIPTPLPPFATVFVLLYQ